eukprot:scaffold159456_cov28-Tisochrysis_lutea.AAC.4
MCQCLHDRSGWAGRGQDTARTPKMICPLEHRMMQSNCQLLRFRAGIHAAGGCQRQRCNLRTTHPPPVGPRSQHASVHRTPR